MINRTIETDRRRPACITDRGCLIRTLTLRVTTLLLLLSVICLTPSQLFSAGEKIAIKQFTANPPSFYSPEKGPMSLSVVADVDRCCGLSGNGSFRFFLRWTFNFNQGTTTVATLTGETEFSNSGDSIVSVPFAASFDGRDSAGNYLAEGGFSILLATDFVRVQYTQDGTYKSERIFSSITYEPGGFTVDRTPPVIQISAPAEGFLTKSNVVVTFSATDANLLSVTATLEKDGGSPVPVTSGAAVTETGEYKIKVLASDKSGNTSEAVRNFEIDKIGPAIQVTSPADGSAINTATVSVTGTATDKNGIATVTVNGISAAVNGDSFTISPVLLSRLGNNTISVVAADQVGNSTTASTNVNLDTAAPVISNVVPADGSDINSLTATVSGTVSDDSAVSTVLVNGTTATLSGSSFSAQVEFGAQGNNRVFIIATDNSGNNATQILSYRVITGVHPPVINPKPPAVTNQNPITIAGTADPGTSIRIAGGAVDQTVPLDTSTFSIQYTLRENQVNSISISAVSGSEESIPETFEITHDNIPPKKPEFLNYTAIIKSSKFGLLGITDELVSVFMDGFGAQQQATSSPGNGAFGFQLDIPPNQTVNVSIKAKDAAGNESEITPAQIRHDPTRVQNLHIALSEPRNWTAIAGTIFPHPLEIMLTDQNGDAVQGYPIVFDVVSGDGLVEGQTTMTKYTNSAGHAFVNFALGPVPGQYNNIVRATFTDNIEAPALFQITGLVPKAGEPTTVEGVVLDENFGAVPGATIILMRDGFSNLSMLSDETGRFTFENVEPGRYHLRADGTTTTLPQQRYPVLAYEIDVFEGQVNTIGMPIFLPRTQVENKLDITGTTSQVYTTSSIPKLKVDIPSGAITYPDGSHSGEFIISPVPIEVLPMPLPNGWATSLAISIQPAGTVFNPPLPITFPNVDGGPAGSKATIVSFDHGAGRYIPVGTATVSPDGSVIISDPGSGIKFGAWHAMVPDTCDFSFTFVNFDARSENNSSGIVQACTRGMCWNGPFPAADIKLGPIRFCPPEIVTVNCTGEECNIGPVEVSVEFPLLLAGPTPSNVPELACSLDCVIMPSQIAKFKAIRQANWEVAEIPAASAVRASGSGIEFRFTPNDGDLGKTFLVVGRCPIKNEILFRGKLYIPKVEITERIYETDNVCNFAPNMKLKDVSHELHLIVGTENGGEIKFSGKKAVVTPDLSVVRSKLIYGVKVDNQTFGMGSQTADIIDVQFEPQDGRRIYEVVYSVDHDSDMLMGGNEAPFAQAVDTKGIKILGLSDADYSESRTQLTSETSTWPGKGYNFAYQLSQAFLLGGTIPGTTQSGIVLKYCEFDGTCPDPNNVSDKKSNLEIAWAHGAGISFDAGCVADVIITQFPSTSQAAVKITDKTDNLDNNVNDLVEDPKFRNAFNTAKAVNPNSGSFTVNFTDVDFQYDDFFFQNSDEQDLTVALGPCKGELSFDVTYTQSGSGYDLTVQVTGIIYDLYDFKYDQTFKGSSAVGRHPATIQILFDSGSGGLRAASGKIFVTEVVIQKQYKFHKNW